MRLESQPDIALGEVWAYLTEAEAHELLAALSEWASDPRVAGWHTHIGEAGAELTIAIGEQDPTL